MSTLTGLNEILSEISSSPSPFDKVRQKYLRLLHEHTGRPVITFYSAAFTKPNLPFTSAINDGDISGLMNACYGLTASERECGLDLILHTPGGSIGATEAIVSYLRQMFGKNIRVIVPQIAMSAGTMIALSATQIILGKQSSLGPIDPQIFGIPANLIVEEFKEAKSELTKSSDAAAYWQIRLMKYPATAFYQANLAVDRAKKNVTDWLLTNMFDKAVEGDVEKVDRIVNHLSDSNENKAHDRHIHKSELIDLGVNVFSLEDDQVLQDLALAVHHSTCLTLTNTNAFRLIENHQGRVNILHHS
jgi:hypothetical protein